MEKVQSEQRSFNEKKEYVKFLFDGDYDEKSGELIMLPFMEHRCNTIIKSKYLGYAISGNYPNGTGLRDTVNLDKFVQMYEAVIDIEKSPLDNIEAMIKHDLDKRMGHLWYLRFWLDKLTPNPENPFVDPRQRFAELNEKYRKGPDHQAGLAEIDKAVEAYI